MKITVQECLNRLARGKISNLALVEKGIVKDIAIPKVIDALNEALLRIYTTLPLKENSLLVELRESRVTYPLTSEHCMSKAPDDVDIHEDYNYYIMDTPKYPFTDDIIAITSVITNFGKALPLNKPNDTLSINTSIDNTIEVNFTVPGAILYVIYKARHPLLDKENLEVKLEIPEVLYGALFNYTAYLLHSDINTQEAVANAQKYFAEYQNIINDFSLNAMVNQETNNNDCKFFNRGWV